MSLDPYGDERLVGLYDEDNGAGEDHDFYLQLADELTAKKVVDFGCGTGLLTRAFAVPGRVVIGVDPSATMLGYARRQPGAEAVTWVDGDASAVEGAGDAELVVSSGNTMMHISTEDFPWVLGALAAALRPGGVLSFESRNPAARAWEQWGAEATYGERDTPAGHLREWMEVTEVDNGRVVFDAHNVFEDGVDTVLTTALYFRTADEIRAGLESAGFGEIEVHAGWRQQPLADDSRLLVFRATKTA
ncbi:class I SAM-dependent methyltransferase [Streptomyces sp. SID13031]|uniref:class I SAM-dependent methyltransferase n=1 Tax=Streptomyces sp. SID13031 TaxID=2706046 RepID=UPI0013C5BF45|nr:class I SAM-dependent methyltransferase [Streptomyces sp. SID13031]NEA33089.1 class I SAM-dependent methyltransferase [Streptomyces sp. SID13031]